VTSDDAVCWPIFPACEAVRAHLTAGSVRRIVAVYMALGLAASLSFARKRTSIALATLLAASVLGTCIYLLDYRLRLNQSYMLAWVVGVFVFARRKFEALSALLVAFYVAAGFLKLTPDWLSGRALYARPWLVPESLVPASCVYVVVLELVLVWGLFNRRAFVRRLVLAQLVLFHAVSWPVVGWFYPLLMFGLLSLFLFAERERQPPTFASLLGGPSRASVLRVVGALAVMQLVPALFRGDAALTGEGRLFALHMFDARVACTGGAVIRAPGRASRTIPLVAESDVRSQCDPIVLLAHAQRVCKEPWARAEGTIVDVSVDAKRASDTEPRPLVRIVDACNAPTSYSAFHENRWIVAR
jgi:hypothetical protein